MFYIVLFVLYIDGSSFLGFVPTPHKDIETCLVKSVEMVEKSPPFAVFVKAGCTQMPGEHV